jgi:hypothetical protein
LWLLADWQPAARGLLPIHYIEVCSSKENKGGIGRWRMEEELGREKKEEGRGAESRPFGRVSYIFLPMVLSAICDK